MRKRKNGRLKLAALAAALALGMAAGEMVSYAVVYYSSENWEDEDYDDEEETASSRTRKRVSEDERSGPGAETQAEIETDSVILQGPSVSQTAPREQYHEEYKIYEESIEDVFFFYSNVKNGGITHEPVILDIPQNLSYTVELNGVPWAYQSGEPISTYGTYVFKLNGIEDINLPLSEQKEYRAVFRFRIQEKPPEEETEAETRADDMSSGFGQSSSGSEWHSFTYDGKPVEDEEILRILESQRSQESREEDENWQGWTPSEESSEEDEETEEESEEETEESPEESESLEEQETAPSLTEEESQEGEENQEHIETAARLTGNGYISRTQAYHPTIGRYEVTFANGKILTSSVPEGYIGSGDIELIFPEDAQIRLYRDDEEIEEIEGNRLTQPGHYRIEVDGQPWFCTIASSVRQQNHYPAPAGMHFISASLDGETLPLSSERYVSMEEDGQYQFVLEGEREEKLNVSLRKDTVPPQAEVRIKGGEAAIQYLSDDIDTIVLEKDGEVQQGFSGYSISRPGKYQLTVTDTAGNASVFRFSLSYKINKYGIIAGVLVVLLIAGGVGFVIYTKRTVKIR